MNTTVDIEDYGRFDLTKARVGVYESGSETYHWTAYDEFAFWEPSRKCVMQTPPKNPQVKQYGRKRNR